MNNKDNIKATGCPCGSGKSAEKCCLPVINGHEVAATAQQLMRSRYTAYALGFAEYILQSWHSSTRPGQLTLDDAIVWTGLKILKKTKQIIHNTQKEAYVEFIASYADRGQAGLMHERSRFMIEAGEWRYVDGDQLEAVLKPPGRNDPCVCGSGKKYKKCCGLRS